MHKYAKVRPFFVYVTFHLEAHGVAMYQTHILAQAFLWGQSQDISQVERVVNVQPGLPRPRSLTIELAPCPSAL